MLLHDRRSDCQGEAVVALPVEHLERGQLALVVAVGHGTLAGGLPGRLVVVEPYSRSPAESINLHSSGRREEVNERRNFRIQG